VLKLLNQVQDFMVGGKISYPGEIALYNPSTCLLDHVTERIEYKVALLTFKALTTGK